MSPSEHANCPWCRTNKWLEIGWHVAKRYVWCRKCDCTGPRKYSDDEAWAAWNAWMGQVSLDSHPTADIYKVHGKDRWQP